MLKTKMFESQFPQSHVDAEHHNRAGVQSTRTYTNGEYVISDTRRRENNLEDYGSNMVRAATELRNVLRPKTRWCGVVWCGVLWCGEKLENRPTCNCARFSDTSLRPESEEENLLCQRSVERTPKVHCLTRLRCFRSHVFADKAKHGEQERHCRQECPPREPTQARLSFCDIESRAHTTCVWNSQLQMDAGQLR